ncbi:MAG: two-component regulator propeller domain-containing protein, partial [Bacteroidia bacterium]
MCSNSLFAQYVFNHIGTRNGLCNDNIATVFEDSRGFIWIGTQKGIDRYDGTHFKHFEHNRFDTTSIDNDVVLSVTEDRSGNIWLGTQIGISKLNRFTYRISHYSKKSGKIDYDWNNHLYLDSSGVLWAGNSKGIYRYDPVADKFIFKMKIHDITSLVKDKQGVIWVGAMSGFYKFDDHLNSLTKINSMQVTSLLLDEKQNIWFGTWGYGINKWNRSTNEISGYKWERNPVNWSATNIVGGISERKEANGTMKLVAATCNGLMVADPENFNDPVSTKFCKHDPADENTLIVSSLSCIFTDKNNVTWIGTTEGLDVIRERNQHFSSVKNIYNGDVNHIATGKLDGREVYLLSTWYGDGVVILDHDFKKIVTVNPKERFGNIDYGQICDAVTDNKNRLWIASFGGLFCYDIEQKKYFHPEIYLQKNFPHKLTCIETISDNHYLIGTYNSGLYLFDSKAGRVEQIFASPNEGNRVWKISKRNNEEFWIAINDKIISYFITTKEFTVRLGKLEGSTSSILFDSASAWVATSKGLLRYFFSGNRLNFYGHEEGFASENIYSACLDEEGNVWLTTEAGLQFFNWKKNTLTLYTKENGTPKTNLNQTLFNVTAGKICFSSNGIVTLFIPSSFKVPAKKVPLEFTDIIVSGKEYKSVKNEIILPYSQNDILFKFAALNFSSTETRYSYQLINGEKEEHTGTSDEANYNNIPPGKYIFRVKASAPDNSWKTNEVFLNVIILPPFWREWWFLTLLTLFILFLIIFLVRSISLRTYREKIILLEKDRAIEQERNRIAQDMHDELGSGLTKIAIMTEVAKKEISAKKLSDELDEISENARDLVDNLNEIIWAMNPHNDNLKNLSAYLREYCNNFTEATNILCHYDFPDPIPENHLSEEKRRNLFLCVKEALNNMVKYAGAKNMTLALVAKTDSVILTLA